MGRQLGIAVLLGVGVLASGSVQAQTTARQVAAETLFSEGRQLLRVGEYAAACKKFEESKALEAALGATLNLANCYELLGRTASAWAEFKVAAAEARRVGDLSRRTIALERADALVPKLTRLRVKSADPKVAVTRNGEAVPVEVFGVAVPADPGSYRIEARAPGKRPWVSTVRVEGAGATIDVQIPELAELPAGGSRAAPTDSASTGAHSAGAGRRTLAWVSGGVGLAGVATGALFGGLAASNWGSAKDTCVDYPYQCSARGVRQAETAESQATVATAAFVVGAVGLGVSAALFLTEPEAPRAEVVMGPASVSVRGRF